MTDSTLKGTPSDTNQNEAPKKENSEVVKMTMAEILQGGLHDKCPPGSLPSCVKRSVIRRATPKPVLPPYPSGSRLRFHFVASSPEEDKVFDDTHKHPKPMELILGKKFKVEIWEIMLNTMVEDEVTKFVVPKALCFYYPMVAKVLRDSLKGDKEPRSKSCCGSVLSGVGYPDLDELLKTPTDMVFIFELLEVRTPGHYEPEAWYMTDQEKEESVGTLHEQGNKLYANRDYTTAAEKYSAALGRLEMLMNKEAPGSPEMKDLKKKKVPLVLNYGMCHQQNKDYYESIRHIDMALEIEPDNVKGLFRRGQCHKFVKDFEGARKDFERAVELDATLKKAVNNELEAVKDMEDIENKKDAQLFQKMMNVRI